MTKGLARFEVGRRRVAVEVGGRRVARLGLRWRRRRIRWISGSGWCLKSDLWKRHLRSGPLGRRQPPFLDSLPLPVVVAADAHEDYQQQHREREEHYGSHVCGCGPEGGNEVQETTGDLLCRVKVLLQVRS